MLAVGDPLGGEARVAGWCDAKHMTGQTCRQRRHFGLPFGHLDLGHGEVGRAVVAPEEVDVPVVASVGPRVAHLLQRLDPLRPQPREVDGAEAGLDLDDLPVDQALVGEDMVGLAVSLDRADAQARRIEIGLAQQVLRHARQAAEFLLEAGIVLQDKLAFVFDRHARIVAMATQTLDDLPTPALILDRAILRRNLKRMSDRLRNAGVMLRPHLKTAKSVEVGRMAVEGHDGRITVSTLAEARYFAEGGFKDILYGVGIVPAKLPAITELRRRGVNLRVVTDNLSVAKAIAA
ncbi:MAG: hypothetical protein EPO67_16190, partial [Reyranella sp.]